MKKAVLNLIYTTITLIILYAIGHEINVIFKLHISFKDFLETNIVNFAIVVATIIWICKKFHAAELIQKMADNIQASVEKSSKDAADAIEEYKQVKQSVKNTPELKEEIKLQAEKNAKCIKEKIEKDTAVKQSEIKQSLTKIFANQFEKYNQQTLNKVYTASIELAKEEIIKRLDSKMHKKLIKSSIKELDNVEGSLS